MTVNNREYWEKFYKNHRINNIPSSFAEYTMSKYLSMNKKLLELGCGNGRDATFFGTHGISVTAVDQVTSEIDFLNTLSIENVDFVTGDFTQLHDFESYDYIYSRFTFHSIDENSENSILEQISDKLLEDGLFLLEARSSKDRDLNKEFGKTHYRRYLDYDRLIKKIEKAGFLILESLEAQGVAIYKDEDPWIVRIVAQQKIRKFD